MNEITIRKSTPDEYPKLIKLLDEAFGFPSERTEGFASLLPKLYHADTCSNIVAVRGGELVGAVGVYYRDIDVCGTRLVSAGIGNVACRADMRGEGIMSRLMTAATDEIRALGADLSDLGGRRHRYAHFGYECAGRVYNFTVRDDAVRHLGIEPKNEMLVLPLDSFIGEAEVLYNQSRVRFIRENFAEVIASWEAESMALVKDGEFAGYAVIDGDRVTELMLVSADDLASAVCALFAHTKEQRITVTLHETSPELINEMHALYDGVNIRGNEQISVMHHRRVASAYLRLAAELYDLPDGELPLLIHGVSCDESFTLRVVDGEVSVTDEVKAPIELSHNDAIALLYGLTSPNRAQLPHSVASWLPLPIYFSSPDCV